jgi:hypothetical protein
MRFFCYLVLFFNIYTKQYKIFINIYVFQESDCEKITVQYFINIIDIYTVYIYIVILNIEKKILFK